tara:strand:+ start:413 stop:673 length:261 start_codon:yes stop_codon:yes gene_type:complete
MDNKFLNKVVGQLVSETRIDYDKEWVNVPFHTLASNLFQSTLDFSLSHRFFFDKHCDSVYGLNDDETDYVWEEYKKIIKDKIDNGQ